MSEEKGVIKRRLVPIRKVSLGDYVKCPHCGAVGRVVWVSQDGEGAAIRCPGRHSQLIRGPSQYGSALRPQTKAQNNMVFLVEAESVKAVAWSQR